MTVIETDRLRYEVRSTTAAGETRQVDMGRFEGSGECDCWNFRKQIKPQVEDAIREWKAKRPEKFTYVPVDRLQCVHIHLVNRHIANLLVQTVRKRFPDDTQPT